MVLPLFLIVTPLAARVQDARNMRFGFMASRRSVWALVGLGLLVATFFAYLYLREWWLERGFRRYRVSSVRENDGSIPAPSIPPRKTLMVGAKPAIKAPGNGPIANQEQARNRLPSPKPTSTQTRIDWHNRPVETTIKPARGLVVVQAEDPFHEIYVDDSFVGNAPARLNLVEGAHWIEIRKVGCSPYRRELQVIAGTEVSLRTVLEKSHLDGERAILPAESARLNG